MRLVPAGGDEPRGGTPMDLELSGRVAVITGCSVGIGREVAKVLAGEGVQTVVIARRGALLQSLQDEIMAAGGSRPTAVDAPDEVWEEAWTLNFTAVRRLTQACLPAMRAREWGRIITITGSSEPSGINAANPAKAAVHVWAKGLSRVVGRDGITVNCLAPGRIHSEQIDQRLHPTEESRLAFAAEIPLGYFGEP